MEVQSLAYTQTHPCHTDIRVQGAYSSDIECKPLIDDSRELTFQEGCASYTGEAAWPAKEGALGLHFVIWKYCQQRLLRTVTRLSPK